MNCCLSSNASSKAFRPLVPVLVNDSESVYECIDLRTDSPCLVSVRDATAEDMRSYDSGDLSVQKSAVFQHPMVGSVKDVVLDRDASKIVIVSEAVVSPNRRSLNTFVKSSYLQDEQYQDTIWEVLKRLECLLSDLQENEGDVLGLPPRHIGFEVKNGSIEYLKLAQPYVQHGTDRKSQSPYKNFPGKPCEVDLAALAYFCFTEKQFFECCKNADELYEAIAILPHTEQRQFISKRVMGKDHVFDEDSSDWSFPSSDEDCDPEQEMNEKSNGGNRFNSKEDQLPEAACQTSVDYEWEDVLYGSEGIFDLKLPEEWGNIPPSDDYCSQEHLLGKFKTLAADDMDYQLCVIPNLDVACRMKLDLDCPFRRFEYHNDLIIVYCNLYCINIFKCEGSKITGISWGKKKVPDILDECARGNLFMLAAAVEVATSKPCLILNNAFGNNGLTITVHYNRKTKIKRNRNIARTLDHATTVKEFAEKMHRAAIGVFEAMLYSGRVPKTLHTLSCEA